MGYGISRHPKIVLLLWYGLHLSTAAMAQSSAHPAGPEHVKKASANEIWAELMTGNKRFVDGKWHPRNHVEQRRELVSGQQPRVAVLSCSDSRVPPEILFDQGLGDLFVVRSAGNSADPIGIGSLEYAVEHLGSTMIVVLGHQSCGAVKAACSGQKPPSPSLEAVVQPILPSCAAAGKQAEKLDLAVRDHVHRTAQGLLEKSEILKHAAQEGQLTIVEAYYDLETGHVVRALDGHFDEARGQVGTDRRPRRADLETMTKLKE
jgi:carbonic anhydrase